MPRLKRFTSSLASGYLLVAVNMVYTLAMMPLVLSYLNAEEFGLWVGITVIAGHLQLLVDFGMSGSVSRILIDHKDDHDSDQYGTVIKTGFIALMIQGLLVVIAGTILSLWLPALMNIPAEYQLISRWLMFGQSVLLGLTFMGRIFGFVLQAHQHYDTGNYAQIGGFVVGLGALWLGLEYQLGLYSMLVSAAANYAFTNIGYLWAAWRKQLLPEPGRWGKADWQMFRTIFSYANDIFLLSAGQVLIGVSQVPVISWTLGLKAVAVWSTMTKTFMLAQQLIARIFDFSSSAFAEMMVRKEQDRLRIRFQDLTQLTTSCGVVLCLAVAACNHSFVQIWMKGRFSWGVENDILMAIFVVIATSTRCHIGLAGLTKEIRAMKYAYFVEGSLFVVLSLVLAPRLGLTGVIIGGITTNLLCSGWYGFNRTLSYFNCSAREFLGRWLHRPAQLFVVLLASGGLVWFATRHLQPVFTLSWNAVLLSILGMVCFWRIGLPEGLRREFTDMLRRRTAKPPV